MAEQLQEGIHVVIEALNRINSVTDMIASDYWHPGSDYGLVPSLCER